MVSVSALLIRELSQGALRVNRDGCVNPRLTDSVTVPGQVERYRDA